MSEKQSEILTITKIVHFLAKDNLGCQAVYVLKSKNDEDEILTNLSYMEMRQDTLASIIEACKTFTINKRNWEFEDYGKNKDDEVAAKKYRIISKKDVPKINKILGKPDDFQSQLNEDFIKDVKFLQFRIKLNDKEVVFCKRFTSGKFWLKETKLFSVIRAGILSLSEENMVELPGDFDCIIYGDEVLIFNQESFEEMFDYQEIHKQDHKKVFDYLEKKINYKITDLDKYKEQCLNHPAKLRKFAAIEEKGIYQLSLNDIKKLVKIRPVPTLKIDVKNKKLDFKEVNAFLQFYNDQHLTSSFTSIEYLAHYKTIENK